MRRYGPKPSHPKDRFWKHVTAGAENECWEWQGNRHTKDQYGLMWGGELYSTKWAKAHRVSWEVHHGDIPAGGSVLHTCDNPPCVNPTHLYIGTAAQNARDRGDRSRGREARQAGEANRNAKLTEAKVRAIITELQRLPRKSQVSIAEEFGISQPQISRIMRRQAWGHLWPEE